MKRVAVKSVRAVGMHHHSEHKALVCRPLSGSIYHCQWEPDNPKDIGNAVVILDDKNIRRAYLTRADAAIISKLFCAGIVNSKMFCYTSVKPHVQVYDVGPQQECTLTFCTHSPQLAARLLKDIDFKIKE